MALPVTAGLAVLSWIWIEKPAWPGHTLGFSGSLPHQCVGVHERPGRAFREKRNAE